MIHHLNLTDTEYAQLAAQGYDPNLEPTFRTSTCITYTGAVWR
jgi:hypothetical protein